jgi:hypothetical protein
MSSSMSNVFFFDLVFDTIPTEGLIWLVAGPTCRVLDQRERTLVL